MRPFCRSNKVQTSFGAPFEPNDQGRSELPDIPSQVDEAHVREKLASQAIEFNDNLPAGDATDLAGSGPRSWRASVTFEKAQRFFVELSDLLVNRRAGGTLKNHQLAPGTVLMVMAQEPARPFATSHSPSPRVSVIRGNSKTFDFPCGFPSWFRSLW